MPPYVTDVTGRTTRSQYRATSRFVLRSARFDDVAAEVTAKGFQRAGGEVQAGFHDASLL
jgi:hypothetical protein